MNTNTSLSLAVFFAHIQEASEQTGQSVKQILTRIKAYGIDALEFDYDVLVSEEDAYSTLLKDCGLKISSIYRFFDFGRTDVSSDDYELIHLAMRFDCTHVMAIPGFYTALDEAGKKQELQNMIQNMQKLVDYGHSHGVQVLMEDFDDPNSPFSTLDGLLHLMTNVSGIGCTFDTGNFIFDSLSGPEAFSSLKPYIRHVHLKDRQKDFSPAAVGTGTMQISQILQLIRQSEYQGYFSIEHFGAPNQLEYIRQSAQWIHKQLTSN